MRRRPDGLGQKPEARLDCLYTTLFHSCGYPSSQHHGNGTEVDAMLTWFHDSSRLPYELKLHYLTDSPLLPTSVFAQHADILWLCDY